MGETQQNVVGTGHSIVETGVTNGQRGNDVLFRSLEVGEQSINVVDAVIVRLTRLLDLLAREISCSANTSGGPVRTWSHTHTHTHNQPNKHTDMRTYRHTKTDLGSQVPFLFDALVQLELILALLLSAQTTMSKNEDRNGNRKTEADSKQPRRRRGTSF